MTSASRGAIYIFVYVYHHPTARRLNHLNTRRPSRKSLFIFLLIAILCPVSPMAFAKFGCRGSDLVHRGVLEVPNGSDHHNARSPLSFPVRNRNGHRRSVGTISASMAEAVLHRAEIEKLRRSGGRGSRREAAVAREEMDRWMKESVVEIVKNLVHAPLLVQVYGGGGAVVAKAEEWEAVKGRWVKGETELPEGMIFVEELDGGESPEGCGCGGEGTRAWGLVVQGKGSETGPVCYLLKTTRVSGSDPGMGSIHFCLVRVSSFTETTESQLRNCWIVGKGHGRFS
ncbi:PREDICTED: uncharacterized protein LOC104826832 [Tarenaya hassleriana]|uniref:uncharacterized protein LOC104826832 n=1 Tax=Tarenaya hassleriana TaxID=28532 RepID=UPI00053C52DD|nr:PREDICTED: uncharacterized protein LOC104826832 [Tarenaya hassleriana]